MKKLKPYIFYMLLLTLIVYIVGYSTIDFSAFLTRVTWGSFLLFSLLMFVSYIQTVFFLKLNLKLFGIREKGVLLFYYSQASNIMNYLPFKAGIVLMGAYLKKKYNLHYYKYIIFTAVNYFFVVSCSIAVLIFLVFSGYSSITYQSLTFRLPSGFGISGGVWLILIFFVASINIAYLYHKRNKIRDYIYILNSNIQVRSKTLYILEYTFQSLVQILLFGLRMYFSFRLAGISISYQDAVLIGVFANLSFIISFTPGAIGIKEGVITAVSVYFTGSPGTGLLASLIDRCMNLIWLIITGAYSLHKIKNLNSSSARNKIVMD